MEIQRNKLAFFFRNLFRGLVWLAIIVTLFIFSKHNVDKDLVVRFRPFFDQAVLILFIYSLSELFTGIIPPELFMIWALRNGLLWEYIITILLLAVISYTAGLVAFLFGHYLHTTHAYKYLRDRFLQKSELLLQTYGLYLILVAALTPLPFSGVSMLVGSVDYPFKKYIYFSFTRFARFALSAYVVWEANMF
jgi:membrane protein DedA with SNARE-associated domain